MAPLDPLNLLLVQNLIKVLKKTKLIVNGWDILNEQQTKCWPFGLTQEKN